MQQEITEEQNMKNELNATLLEKVNGGTVPELPAIKPAESNYSASPIDGSEWSFDIQKPTEPGTYRIQKDIDLDGGYAKPTGGEPIV